MQKRIFLFLVIVSLCFSNNFINPDGSIDVKSIQDRNQQTNASWTAGENFLTNMSEEERSQYLGYLPSGLDSLLLKHPRVKIKTLSNSKSGNSTLEAPDYWDWRDVDGQDWTTSIRSQGGCGSCWAFATVCPIETAINIALDDPDFDIDLSEEMLVHDCYPRFNCSGGNYDSYNYVLNNALCTEYCYPYTATDGACAPCENWMDEVYSIDSIEVFIGSGYTAEERVEAIKEMVYQGPVSVAFTVISDFYVYTEGVYHSDEHYSRVNHGVAIIGYDFRSDEPHWICKNSWGAGWGDEGYFKIGINVLNIDNFAYRPIFTNGLGLVMNRNIAPTDNFYTNSLTPELIWSYSTFGENLNFEIQIATDIDFESPITINSQISTDGFTGVLPTVSTFDTIRYSIGSQGESLNNFTTYWWKVRAVIGDGSSNWSLPTSFSVNDTIDSYGWYQTLDEQFEKNEYSDQSFQTHDDNLVVFPTGYLLGADFEYLDEMQFLGEWTIFEGSDSSGMYEDSLISVSWTDEYLSSILPLPSPSHYLKITDNSLEKNGYAYYDGYIPNSGVIEMWVYIPDLTTTCRFFTISQGDVDESYFLSFGVDSIGFYDQFRFVFKLGAHYTNVWGEVPESFVNVWHNFRFEYDLTEPYGERDGTMRIYLDDALFAETGTNFYPYSKLVLGNGSSNTNTYEIFYDDISITTSETYTSTFTSPEIVKQSDEYWNKLFVTGENLEGLELQIQYKLYGTWVDASGLPFDLSSAIELNLLDIDSRDTLRFYGEILAHEDTIYIDEWGVTITDEEINTAPYFTDCPDSFFFTIGEYPPEILTQAYDSEGDSIFISSFITPSTETWWDDSISNQQSLYELPYLIIWFFSSDPADTGSYEFGYQVCDEHGLCDSCVFYVTIIDTVSNTAPYFTDCPDSAIVFSVGEYYPEFVCPAFDSEGDSIFVSRLTTPISDGWWVDSTFNLYGSYPSNEFFIEFYLTTEEDAGSYEFGYQVCDEHGLCDSCYFTVIVTSDTSTNTAPYFSSCDDTFYYSSGSDANYFGSAVYDDDGDSLYLRRIYPVVFEDWCYDTVANMHFGAVYYTYMSYYGVESGTYDFAYQVCDQHGLCDTCITTVVIDHETDTNEPPYFSECPDSIILYAGEGPTEFITYSHDEYTHAYINRLLTPPPDDWWVDSIHDDFHLLDEYYLSIVFNPGVEDIGTYEFGYEVLDLWGLRDSCYFTVIVTSDTSTNSAPYFTDCPDSAIVFSVGEYYPEFVCPAYDSEGDSIFVSRLTTPISDGWWVDSTFNLYGSYPSNEFFIEFYLTTEEDAGSYEFGYQVCDEHGLCDSCYFTIIIDSDTVTNHAPEITRCADTVTVYAESWTTTSIYAEDIDDDYFDIIPLSYPEPIRIWWLDTTFIGESGYAEVLFTLAPTVDNVGYHEFCYALCDEHGLCDTCCFIVHVIDTSSNTAPYFADCPDSTITITVGDPYWGLNCDAFDDEGDSIYVSRLIAPPTDEWFFDTISNYDGFHYDEYYFSVWLHSTDIEDVGSYELGYQVCDEHGLCDSCYFTVSVVAPNSKPEIYDCPESTLVYISSTMYTELFSIEDEDGDELTVTFLESPTDTSWWDFELIGRSGTYFGRFVFEHHLFWEEEHYFSFVVCDSLGRCDTCSFDVNLVPDSTPINIPVFSGWNLLSNTSGVTEPYTIWSSTSYSYNADARRYELADSLYSGFGYFALFPSASSIPYSPGLHGYSIELFPGWNLIGSVDHPVLVETISTIPSDSWVAPIYYWNSFSYTYEVIDTLYPGRGYWILSTDRATIFVGP